jgi:hypothetical protein
VLVLKYVFYLYTKQIYARKRLYVVFFPFKFSVSTQADSASPNVDYVTKTESVTFQPSETLDDETSEIFTIVAFTIINDQRIEEGESFKVILNAVSSQVTLGAINEHTVQIIDDDCKY